MITLDALQRFAPGGREDVLAAIADPPDEAAALDQGALLIQDLSGTVTRRCQMWLVPLCRCWDRSSRFWLANVRR
jgi:hypothetical protein